MLELDATVELDEVLRALHNKKLARLPLENSFHTALPGELEVVASISAIDLEWSGWVNEEDVACRIPDVDPELKWAADELRSGRLEEAIRHLSRVATPDLKDLEFLWYRNAERLV